MIVFWACRTAEHVFDSIRAKGLEWICTLAGFLFGFALIQPASTFSLSPAYAMLAQTTTYVGATEEGIGWSVLTASLVRFAVLAYNGLWTSSPLARRALALMFSLFWCFIFTGFVASIGLESTGSVYLAFLTGEAINVIRTSYETGRIKILRRGMLVNDVDPRH